MTPTNFIKTPKNTLQSAVDFGIISPQSKKTIASRDKLNLLQAHSTPQACFFMRNIRTPKERADFVFTDQKSVVLSMVERSGKGFALCRFPLIAVFEPVTFYRPKASKLFAVDPENLSKDTAEMIYKFLCVNRTHTQFNLCVQTIESTDETRARLCLSADYRHLATIARINPIHGARAGVGNA